MTRPLAPQAPTSTDGRSGAAPTWAAPGSSGPPTAPTAWTGYPPVDRALEALPPAWAGYPPVDRAPEAIPPAWSLPPDATPPAWSPLPGSAPRPGTVTMEQGLTSGAGAPRHARRSRTADLALLVAAFVATAGVAFAVGRWTMQQSSATTPSLAGAGTFGPFAGAVVPAVAAGDGSTNSTTGGDRRAEAAAAAGISAVDQAALASPGPGLVTAGTATDATGASVPAAGDGATGDTAAAPQLANGPGGAVAAGSGQAAGAPPAGAQGSSPGGMGGPPGMGPGGLEGTVSAVGEGSLTLTTDDGSSVTLATDDATAWVRETPIEATAIQAGDRVSVELPFGGFGREQAQGEQTLVAEQVTLLPEP
jgi:hypothetical protein